jgi:Flp pilus assembly protein TadG
VERVEFIRRTGSALIYVTVAMVAMCAVGSLAMDYGRAQVVKTELTRAADAAALAALQAIDAKDHNKLSDVGGAIDEACEQCHTTYWYPDEKKPGEATASAN